MADSTSLVLYDPRTADPEVITLAGFLAGYGGRTREAYASDLRQFFAWCGDRQLRLSSTPSGWPPPTPSEPGRSRRLLPP